MKKYQLEKQSDVMISKPAAFLYRSNGEKEIELSFLTVLPLLQKKTDILRFRPFLGKGL